MFKGAAVAQIGIGSCGHLVVYVMMTPQLSGEIWHATNGLQPITLDSQGLATVGIVELNTYIV